MKLSINDQWKYKRKDGPEESSVMVSLPHTNIETPYQYFDESIYQFESCYEKTIYADNQWKGQHVFLVFEAVAHIAKVHI